MSDDEEDTCGFLENDTGQGLDDNQSVASAASGVKKKKKKKNPAIRINLTACKYEVLRIVQRKLGWKEVGDDDDWEIYWTDTSVSIERIMKLTKTQKINHFNGMLEICRKRAMAKNLMKMAKVFPESYDFFPKTFVLPSDLTDLLVDVKAKGRKQIYILKPDAGCQGRGIRLAQGGSEQGFTKVLKDMDTQNVVAQHYLHKPFLIHGFKFDLRVYALVISCDPLRTFLFHEGLVRICTEKYAAPKASNLSVAYMHLTNYAVNKHNENFVANNNPSSGQDASKWSFAQLAQYITDLGHDWQKVWDSIADLIIKSLIAVQPVLRNNYRSVLPPDNDGFSCFEILGYDIMLDRKLSPWLIEVNHSPSFNIDSPLDLAIKEQLITDTIDLVRVDPKLIQKTKKAEKKAAAGRLLAPLQKKPGVTPETPSKQKQKPRTAEELEAWRADILRKREKYEAKHLGGFTRIFPAPDDAKQALYVDLLKGASEVFNNTFSSKNRSVISAISDQNRKQKEEETTGKDKPEKSSSALRDRLAQLALQRKQASAKGSRSWLAEHIHQQQQQLQQAQEPASANAFMPNPGLAAGEQPYAEEPGEEVGRLDSYGNLEDLQANRSASWTTQPSANAGSARVLSAASRSGSFTQRTRSPLVNRPVSATSTDSEGSFERTEAAYWSSPQPSNALQSTQSGASGSHYSYVHHIHQQHQAPPPYVVLHGTYSEHLANSTASGHPTGSAPSGILGYGSPSTPRSASFPAPSDTTPRGGPSSASSSRRSTSNGLAAGNGHVNTSPSQPQLSIVDKLQGPTSRDFRTREGPATPPRHSGYAGGASVGTSAPTSRTSSARQLTSQVIGLNSDLALGPPAWPPAPTIRSHAAPHRARLVSAPAAVSHMALGLDGQPALVVSSFGTRHGSRNNCSNGGLNASPQSTHPELTRLRSRSLYRTTSARLSNGGASTVMNQAASSAAGSSPAMTAAVMEGLGALGAAMSAPLDSSDYGRRSSCGGGGQYYYDSGDDAGSGEGNGEAVEYYSVATSKPPSRPCSARSHAELLQELLHGPLTADPPTDPSHQTSVAVYLQRQHVAAAGLKGFLPGRLPVNVSSPGMKHQSSSRTKMPSPSASDTNLPSRSDLAPVIRKILSIQGQRVNNRD